MTLAVTGAIGVASLLRGTGLMTRKEVEEIIRRAFEIDRAMPFPRPKNPASLIGKMIVIADLRAATDVEEREYIRITADDIKLWETVMLDWMPQLKGAQKAVVKYRCCGMGWKRIARTLVEKKITYREFGRTTLWQMFVHGLDEFVNKG
jgi:hypothetical protein